MKSSFWEFSKFFCFIATGQKKKRNIKKAVIFYPTQVPSEWKWFHTWSYCNHWTETVQCVKVAAVLWTRSIITAYVESHFEPTSPWPDLTLTWIYTTSAHHRLKLLLLSFSHTLLKTQSLLHLKLFHHTPFKDANAHSNDTRKAKIQHICIILAQRTI